MDLGEKVGLNAERENGPRRKNAEKTNGVNVTTGRLRFPRLMKRSVDQADIVCFLKVYDEYERKMTIAEEFGIERTKAGL